MNTYLHAAGSPKHLTNA